MFLLLFLLSSTAAAFPSNARLGYGNCGSCHHAPTGGGILNEYGASTASEISSIAFADSEDTTKGHPFVAGGDMRYMYIHSDNKEVAFPMQADVEVGFSTKRFKTIVQGGVYGPSQKIASYRAYTMYTSGPHSYRLGHFAPAFGINEPDHYLPGRNSMGFDNRRASLNLEYNYAGRHQSYNFTLVAGHQGILYDPEADGIYLTRGKVGPTFQWAVFPQKGFWGAISATYLFDIEKQVINPQAAFSVITGSSTTYGKAEYAIELDAIQQQILNDLWAELTFVPFKGFHYSLTLKHRRNSSRYGTQLVWYAMPGVEVQALMERQVSQTVDLSTFYAIMHLYF